MSFDAFQGSGSASAPAATPAPASAPAATPAPTAAPASSPSTPASPAAQPAAATGETAPKAGVTADQLGQTPPPAPYTPNLKYKASGKEMEFDAFLKDVVKDADTEKKVREMYEKAHGLEVLKPRHQQAQERLKTVEGNFNFIKEGLDTLKADYARGDFESFFKRLNVPEEKVLQWVINKAQYNELPPEQKRVFDEKRAAEQRNWELEKHNQTLSSRYEEQVTQAKATSLQIALEKPDLKPIVEAFNTRAGKPDAFWNAVVDAGELAFARSQGKVDLTPEQAIQQVLQYWGNPIQAQPQPAQPVFIPQSGIPDGAPAETGAAKPAKAPAKTIPNVSGKQTAAVSSSKPKSLADLKKLRIEKYGA